MQQAETGKQTVRYLFADHEPELEGIIWGRARKAGHSELSVFPMFNVDGTVDKAIVYGTKKAGGFSDEELKAFQKLQAPMTRMLEVYALVQDMRGLLSTYVGRGVGKEVLGGKIQRGDGETIFAVILFADVKGFTEMSNTRPAPEVIHVLNQFYDAVEPAVRDGNGEILKFIGDGVLAIFPIKDDLSNQDWTAAAALNAVKMTRKTLESDAQKTKIEFRAALHVGDIFYGNIGSARRLDFTAIGKSVNLASRMAEDASRRDAQLVCSSEFFDITSGVDGHQVTSQLKGFHEAVRIVVLD